jgi:hypothetical protein
MPPSGFTFDSTPVFYFLILPSVPPIVIVIMYHLVPAPKSFEMILTYILHLLRNAWP